MPEQNIPSKKDIFNRVAFQEALLTKRVVNLKIGVREAAAQVGISASTLSRCEGGEYDPDVYTYFYCCRWLGVSMETFFKIPFHQMEISLIDLREMRKKNKLTLQQVQDKTGIHISYLSKLEIGKAKKPPYKLIERLKKLYSGC